MDQDEKCRICGRPATRFLFATFVCDDEVCIEKARIERGGPGGHKKRDLSEILGGR
ncbi:MAG: hypothetical protein JSV90_06725 [Methanobacteriota archaeon]|nr:MAG: hypothetical protein JSV90_06725 [Euryarchaeota archaeon]